MSAGKAETQTASPDHHIAWGVVVLVLGGALFFGPIGYVVLLPEISDVVPPPVGPYTLLGHVLVYLSTFGLAVLTVGALIAADVRSSWNPYRRLRAWRVGHGQRHVGDA